MLEHFRPKASRRRRFPAVTASENEFPRESWAFKGYATPEFALVSLVAQDNIEPEKEKMGDPAFKEITPLLGIIQLGGVTRGLQLYLPR